MEQAGEGPGDASVRARSPVLVVAWCADGPDRVGEVLRVPARGTWLFGRGSADAPSRLSLQRSRPDLREPRLPLETRFLSREQLAIRRTGDENLELENRGKCLLKHRGRAVDRCELGPGDVVELADQLVLIAVLRDEQGTSLRDFAVERVGPYGDADMDGLVGESETMWRLREHVAFIAKRDAHVLVSGASGVGKELFARAIHAQSPRRGGPFVSRNAATLPEGLIDVELFGNAKNYPNPGMAERPGLIGEAHGGTLFLDEIGELPAEMQSHLLRVLDRGGEYQRLGETGRRHADIRLVAATNRAPEELKLDLGARLALRVQVPGLGERREDLPLIARHLLLRAARRDRELGERFFERWDGTKGEPRFSAQLVVALLEHHYQAHVRELEALLWQALATTTSGTLELTAALTQMLSPPVGGAPIEEVSIDELRASMARHGGMKEKVWRELGLANRYVLRRLLKKHDIADAD